MFKRASSSRPTPTTTHSNHRPPVVTAKSTPPFLPHTPPLQSCCLVGHNAGLKRSAATSWLLASPLMIPRSNEERLEQCRTLGHGDRYESGPTNKHVHLANCRDHDTMPSSAVRSAVQVEHCALSPIAFPSHTVAAHAPFSLATVHALLHLLAAYPGSSTSRAQHVHLGGYPQRLLLLLSRDKLPQLLARR